MKLDVDEFCTSKLYYHCHFEMAKVKYNGKEINSALHCSSNDENNWKCEKFFLRNITSWRRCFSGKEFPLFYIMIVNPVFIHASFHLAGQSL